MDPLAVDQPEDFSDRRSGSASEPADYSSSNAAVDKLRLFAERQEKSNSLYHPENDNKSAFKSGSSNTYNSDRNLAALGGHSQLGYPYFGQYNPYHNQQINRPSAEKLEIFPSTDGGINSQSASTTANKRSSEKLEIFPSEINPDKSTKDKYSSNYGGDMSRNFSTYSNNQQQASSSADQKAERFPPCAQTPVKKPDVFSHDLDQALEVFPQTPKKSNNEDIFIDGEHRRPKTEDCDDSPPNLTSKKEIFSSDENEMTESDKFEFFSTYGKKMKDKIENYTEDSHTLKVR